MIRVTKKLLYVLTEKQRRKAVLLVIMMLIGGILESIGVSLVLPLITAISDKDGWRDKWYAKAICDFFSIEDQRTYIFVILVALIMAFIVKNLYLILEYNIQYGFIAKCRYELQKNLIHQYTVAPYEFYLNANSGEIIRILSNDTFYTFTLLTALMCVYTELIVSVILIVTIVAISPMIALWLSIFLAIEVFLIWKLIKPVMKKEGWKLLAENGAANKWSLQIINGIKSIKVGNKEDYFEKNYNIHAQAAVDASRNNQTFSILPRILIEMITVVAVLLLVLIQLCRGINLLTLVPQLSAFVVATVRLLPSVNRMSTNINQIPYYEGAVDTVTKALKADVADTANHVRKMTKKNENKVSLTFQRSLDMDAVTYHYPDRDRLILDHTSMKIGKGQSIGLVGASGAGKTTVLDILLGLLKPQSGSVLIDDRDIEENLSEWLSLLSYIPQNVFLVDDSIRNNVAFGIDQDKIDDNEVWRALCEAQMDEFVKSLPEGLDTGVGEKGIRLSGGQCQRIGIARALYKNPEILFLTRRHRRWIMRRKPRSWMR